MMSVPEKDGDQLLLAKTTPVPDTGSKAKTAVQDSEDGGQAWRQRGLRQRMTPPDRLWSSSPGQA